MSTFHLKLKSTKPYTRLFKLELLELIVYIQQILQELTLSSLICILYQYTLSNQTYEYFIKSSELLPALFM